MKYNTLLLLIVTFINNQLFSQQVVSLYKDSIPNSIIMLPEDEQPTITIYLPEKEKSNGSGIIIFPGGAYSFLATSTEGIPIAHAFVDKGFACFVVKYRLPNDDFMKEKSMVPLMDAQAAIKFVRDNSNTYMLDKNKIGIIGFSAGGHLASTLGTHFSTDYIPNSEKTSLRPDFMILVYPVISMDSLLTHKGSRQALLGNSPSAGLVDYFSSEKQVTSLTPPTYLTHTSDDNIVSVNNSIAFYRACVKNKVDAEMHLFPRGNHGFIQRLPTTEWLEPICLFLNKEVFNEQK